MEEEAEAELGFWMGMREGEGSGRGSSEMSRVGWAAPCYGVVVPGLGRWATPGPWSVGRRGLGLLRAKWCWDLVGGRTGAGPWSAGEMVLGLGRPAKWCWAMASFRPLVGKKETKRKLSSSPHGYQEETLADPDGHG